MRIKLISLALETVSRFIPRDGSAVGPGKALYRKPRRQSAAAIGAAFVVTLRALRRWMRLAKVRYNQWREARATYESLRHLDDRALRDLGFDRLEISSVAAEASGRVERTRAHALASF